MPLATIIAGRYTGTWNSLSTGILDDAGFKLMSFPKEQKINKSDAYAQTLIETVHQGVDWSIMFTMIEYGAAAVSTIISPWATLGQLGVISILGTGIAKALVLTAVAGTPAATSPATFTASLAKLSDNSNVELSFTSAMRVVPVRLDLFPDTSGGAQKHFVTT